MKRYFLYRTNSEFSLDIFKEEILSIDKSLQIETFDSTTGYLVGDSYLVEELDKKIDQISILLGTSISILASHDLSDLMKYFASDGLKYFPNQVVFPADILTKYYVFNYELFINSLKKLFEKLTPDLLSTAGTYLKMGLDAVHTAKRLNLHRNTLNYRLDKIYELTNIDIRDYQNSILLEFYFGFAN